MIPKISIDILNNDFYNIANVNNVNTQVSYLDFQYSTSITTTSPIGNSYPITISPNIFTKSIQLDYLDISINSYMNFNSVDYTKLLLNNIKNEINKSFFKKLTSLGEKHRITAPVSNFDIKMNDIKLKCKNEKISVTRFFTSKLITISNYIATVGRIGPSQWILSNTNTYRYLLNNLDGGELNFDKGLITFGNMHYIVDDLVDDDILLLGRKNDITASGLHCFILTDNNKNILINEIRNADYSSRIYRIYYKIEDLGLNPEYNFMKLNTQTISYYRAKKLQRIKDLYGN